jgi:hypothetical protein
MATQNSGYDWSAFMGQAPTSWIDGCKALAEASKEIADRWIKNRAAQVERDLAVWTKLATCKDSHEVAALQKRWWEETLANLTAEAKAYQEQVASLTQSGLSALRDAPAARPPKAPPKVV